MNDAIVAPAPGSTPIKNPIRVPRTMAQRLAIQSRYVGIRLRMLSSTFGGFSACSTLASTSPTPNSATASTRKSMPSISHSWPNMNRVFPTCGSTPIVAIIRPTSPIIRPFTRPPPTNDSDGEADQYQREIFGRPEVQSDSGERRRHQHQPERANRARQERSDRGHAQRRTRTSIARHLIAVEAGHHRR